MDRSTIYARTLRILDTNSNAYQQTDFNNDLNEALALRIMQILRLKGYKHITQTHAYTDLMSSVGLSEGDNGYNGEYSLPTDLLDITRIEVSFDGANWHVISKEKGNLYDLSQNLNSEQDATDINSRFTTSNPMATILRGSIFVRPLNTGSTVSNGMRIFYGPRQTDMDENTDTPPFETNLHQALIYDCAEMEMMAHPSKYDSTRESRIRKKKKEVDKEFMSFYRRRFKPVENLKVTQESFK